MEEQIGLQEFLDVLPTPAFIVDLREYGVTSTEVSADSIRFAVMNKSARDGVLGNSVVREINDNDSFRRWIIQQSSDQDIFEGDDLDFTSNVLRGPSILDLAHHRTV
jgi:hypothetical protein